MQRRKVLNSQQSQGSNERKLQISSLLKKQRPKVLPSIPDKRNRYGIEGSVTTPFYIDKSDEELQKEKQIMRNYRSTLIDRLAEVQGARNKHLDHSRHTNPSLNKLHTIAQRLLPINENKATDLQRKISCTTKQRKKKWAKTSSNVIQHDYSYQKIGSQNFRPYEEAWLRETTQKQKNKWQFFNSSQLRFKEPEAQGKKQGKKSVGVYLQLMQRQKVKRRSECI